MDRYCPTCHAVFPENLAHCPDDGTPLEPIVERRNLVGERIDGKYDVTELIGTGGMGTVYRARQAAMDRDVALKVLDFPASTDETNRQRFFAEARAASRLRHPNTIRIYGFGEHAGLLYMLLELLTGKTLAWVIDTEGPMEPERAVRIAVQIADSLAEAHDQGVVHRDLKPDNIFVESLFGNPDHVKVLDFGIAKLRVTDGSGLGELTEPDMVCGTPSYMSPEQVEGGPVDGRADVYGLGLLLWEMLTGQPLFAFESNFETMMAQLSAKVPPLPMKVRSRVSLKLEELLLRMLAKSAQDRPQSCEELREELLAAIAPDLPPAATERPLPCDTLPLGSGGLRPLVPTAASEPSDKAPEEAPEPAKPSPPKLRPRPVNVRMADVASARVFDVVGASRTHGVLSARGGTPPKVGTRLVLWSRDPDMIAVEVVAEVGGPPPKLPLPGYFEARWLQFRAFERREHLRSACRRLLGDDTPDGIGEGALAPGEQLICEPVSGEVSLHSAARR